MTSVESYNEAPPSIGIANFTADIFQQKVYYHVMKLDNSVLIWIGSRPAQLSSLAVAMQTSHVSFVRMKIMIKYTFVSFVNIVFLS